MDLNRRRFLKASVGGSALAVASAGRAESAQARPTVEELDQAAAEPILKLDALKSPVKIASLELLRNRNGYFVRAASTDGAVGVGIANGRAAYLYPILDQLVIPYFIGKDARDLEALVDGVYVYKSNYKLAGLALWNCVAWVEFSLLDLLGRIAKQSVGELLGVVVRREAAFYVASGRRDTTPEQEVELLAKTIEETGTRAIKFKVGGRMSNNRDSMPGRTEGLIALARKRLGDQVAIHADSNGSYDPPKAIEIGKRLEAIDAHFFEEPCPFDHLEDTKRVADALTVPVAGGEQETSLRRFRWTVHNRGLDIVQPDLHYNGGYIRATRVARMAARAGMKITPHISGDLGFIDVLHFASCTPNLGAYQEYKGGIEKWGPWFDPPVRLKDGAVNVPTGPGLGVVDPAALLDGAGKIVPE